MSRGHPGIRLQKCLQKIRLRLNQREIAPDEEIRLEDSFWITDNSIIEGKNRGFYAKVKER